ncbi:hypothetical protein [Telluribacter humicola]|uniref:hypothetical protein n=1 Tax=Telluribacter humicola TaxID=1720261 RepID=UPI001A9718D1|nr:hypothetical protein [Telluribacter humicola]
MKIGSTVILIMLLLISFLVFSQTPNSSLGTIIFNLKFSSFSETGLGGKVKVVNIATGEEHLGKSPNGLNSYIIIEDLPKGIYKVVELLIKTGSGQIHYYDESKFNHLEVTGGETLYLGSYKVKKTSQLLKLNYELFHEKNIDTVKINEQSLKISGIENDINFTQKLFKYDTIYLNLRQ